MEHLDDMLEDIKDSQEASSPSKGSLGGTPSVMSAEDNFDEEKTVGT